MSMIVATKTHNMTEWESFRNRQLALLKLIKSQTGRYISGKGNVMKFIGELWRNMKITEMSNKNLSKNEKQYLTKLIYKKYKIESIIDENGVCKSLVHGKITGVQKIQYV